MLKRGLSVFLAAALMILCFFSVPVFAAEPEFDISDYTIEDLETMTTAEKKKLMEDFIEAYNPYGLRDLMEQEASASGGFGVQPLWKSDGSLIESGQQMATHQLITLEAMLLFITENGFFYNVDSSQQLMLALYLASASALPDKDETSDAFAWHFYDPDTGMNYRNQNSPTARTQAGAHYYSSYAKLNTNVNMDVYGDDFTYVLKELGCALHYLQDVCEPHHAANKTAYNSNHMVFETHVENHINAYLDTAHPISAQFYTMARTKAAVDITHDAAVKAKPYYENIRVNPGKWDSVGETCVWNAVHYSVALIYKLFYSCNASFLH